MEMHLNSSEKHPGAIFVPSWGCLGAILGRLGGILVRLGAIVGRRGAVLEVLGNDV